MEADRKDERQTPAAAPTSASEDAVARARMAAIVDSSDDAIISKNLNGVIQTWNRGAEALFGYTAEEAIGQPVTMLIPEDRFNEEPDILDRIRRGVRIDHYETVRRRKDGALIDISLTVSPIVDEHGTVIGASKIARNITERKRAERALRFRTEQFETLFSEVPVGVYLLDDLLRVRELNPVAQHAFGEISSGLIGRPFDELARAIYPRELADETTRIFHHTLETGEPHVSPERAELRLDLGSTHYFDWRVNRIKLPDGGHGLVCCFRDISNFVVARADRQRLLDAERDARMAADQANRVKDEFLATLSHELRSPMNAVLSWLHLMQLKPDDTSIVEQGLAAMDRGVRTQVQLIDDLLDLNRIVSGKLRIETELIQIDAVLDAALETVTPQANAQGVTLGRGSKSQGLSIRGDFTRLQQVFWNLLTNAIKFSSRGGQVDVAVERVDERVRITVSDTGQGIAPELLPYVFDRFRQADSSRTRRHGGLGLGLAIVKHLVELHGGSVQAESPGLGQGATFTVTLPASVHGTGHGRDARPASIFGDVDLTGVEVLLVDDDPGTLAAVGRILTEYNAHLQTAASVDEALEHFDRSHPDILISDISMPERDGYELIHELRARPRGKTIPAVALTAFARSEDRIRAFEAGFNLHVTKPADPRELLAVIASAVHGGAKGRRGAR